MEVDGTQPNVFRIQNVDRKERFDSKPMLAGTATTRTVAGEGEAEVLLVWEQFGTTTESKGSTHPYTIKVVGHPSAEEARFR
jgi:hypothetical protein